jgi:hypothetical protein
MLIMSFVLSIANLRKPVYLMIGKIFFFVKANKID